MSGRFRLNLTLLILYTLLMLGVFVTALVLPSIRSIAYAPLRELNAAHGIDPAQPQTVLEVPEADVLFEAWELWEDVKKPVDLVVVMNISGNMSGARISAARTAVCYSSLSFSMTAIGYPSCCSTKS